MLNTIKRYYTSAKIFKFFYRHPWVYFYVMKSLFRQNILKRKSRPRNLVLKLSDKCNAKCSFCYAQFEQKSTSKIPLSISEMKEIIIQGKKLGCYTITLTGGEPLIYPQIEELISFIVQNKMVPFTTTNGLEANVENVQKLVKHGLCALNWSVHGSSSEDHDSLVGVEGAYDTLLKNAMEAVKMPLINIVNHVLTNESFKNQDLQKIIDKFMGMGFRAVNLLPICMNGNQDDLLNENALRYLDEMAKKDFILMDTKNYTHPICPAGREDILVNNYGEIQACPFIPISFGNMHENSLENTFKRIQNHPMFLKESPICMPARDKEFIEKYMVPIFNRKELPYPIDEIEREFQENA